MIGSARFTAAFASGADTSDPVVFRAVVREAARLGFAIVFLETGSKIPLCPLSSVKRVQADKEAREAAREAGDRKWDRREHECGVKHASADPAELDRFLLRRFKNGGTAPNIAIEPSRSGMFCVDVDTVAELEGWARSWREATGEDWLGGLTVSSPGVVDADGTWKHKGGGHLWFDLTAMPADPMRDVVLAAGEGVFKHPFGWTAMYRDRYTLVPPSVRPEGRYEYRTPPRTTGLNWVLAEVARSARVRMDRAAEAQARREARLSNGGLAPGERGLIEWSQRTSWTDLLAPLGWLDTGLVHSCGCPDWTMAPVEDHGSARSATTHEDTCGASHYTNDEGHTAIHLWTDTRPGFLRGIGPTLTKVQFVAAVARDESRHGRPLSSEDISAGLRSQGLSSTGVPLEPLQGVVVETNPVTALPVPPAAVTEAVERLQTAASAPVATPENLENSGTPVPEKLENLPAEAEGVAPALRPLGALPAPAVATPKPGLATLGAPPEHRADGELNPQSSAAHELSGYSTADHFLNLAQLWGRPKPPPLIEGMLDLQTLTRVFGQSGHGKSFVAVDIALCVALGRSWAGLKVAGWGRVVYLAAEDAIGVGERIMWWAQRAQLGAEDAQALVERIRVIPLDVQAATEDWDKMIGDLRGFGPSLVFVDTQAQTSAGYEENSNSDMGVYAKRLRQVVANTGACVAIVAHTTKDGLKVRGAGAVYNALDSEFQVTSDKARDQFPTITIENTKAKHRREWADPIVGALVSWDAGTGDGSTKAAMSWDPMNVPAEKRDARSAPPSEGDNAAVLEVLAERPLTGMGKNAWATACALQLRMSKATADRAIERLIASGKVTDDHSSVVGAEVEYRRGMNLRALKTEPEPEVTTP